MLRPGCCVPCLFCAYWCPAWASAPADHTLHGQTDSWNLLLKSLVLRQEEAVLMSEAEREDGTANGASDNG